MKKLIFLGVLCWLVNLPLVVSADFPQALERPVWKVNDEWTYDRKAADGKVIYRWKLIVIETETDYNGRKGCYKVAYQRFSPDTGQEFMEDRVWNFYGHNLAFLGTMSLDSKTTSIESNIVDRFNWPLAPGKKWEQGFIDKDRSGNSWPGQTFFTSEVDRITTPTGELEAVKITQRFLFGGKWSRTTNTLWYCPDVGYYVRFHRQDKDGGRIDELVEYKLAK